MRKAALVLLLLLTPAIAVAAQKPPAQTPQQKLNQLFGDLKQAQDSDDAKDIEQRISNIFLASGSSTVDLLMVRAQAALAADKLDVARKLIQSVTIISPNYAEGWHRLAALQAQAKDDRGAMLSLQKVITLNPRHFTAYAELGSFLEDYGDKPGALKLYRKALALDPKMENIDKTERALAREVEGEGI
jgi:tetratricopeptide (TPR) repeat protein